MSPDLRDIYMIRDTEIKIERKQQKREYGTSIDRYIEEFCLDHRTGRYHDDDDRVIEY